MLASPATACLPPVYVAPPTLPGESDDAYRARIEQQARRDAQAQLAQIEAGQLARENELWRSASPIVVMEVVRVSRMRNGGDGNPHRLITLRQIVTERGGGAPRRINLTSYASGSMCLAPAGPVYPESGVVVVFARNGKLSDAAVIDWSSAGRSTHPETLALLERASGPRD